MKKFGSYLTLVVFIVLTGGLSLTVVLHELGHWLGARAAGGFRLKSFAVFPLTWERTEEKWVCTRRWRKWWQEAGRIVVTPLSLSHLRWRALAMFAGGPLMSFACCVALGAAFVGLGMRMEHRGAIFPLAIAFCVGHLAMHAFTVFLTLLPVKSMPGGTIPTDGWKILALLRGDPVLLAQWASLVVLTTLRDGRPLTGVLDRDALAALARREPAQGYLHFLMLLGALGRGDLNDARALTGEALKSHDDPKAQKPAPGYDRTADFFVFFVALTALEEKDAAAARGAFARIAQLQGAGAKIRIAIARAAVATAEARAEDAQAAVLEFDECVRTAAFPAAESAPFDWICARVRPVQS